MRGSYKARGQRGPNRASLDLTSIYLIADVHPSSTEGRNLQRFAENVLGAVAAWKHRENRRRGADQAVFS